jgi:glutamate-1-semialdehyde aminotransferase
LSVSQANTEALRLARHATGRSRVLSFVGNYGGHGDEFLAAYSGRRSLSYLGLAAAADRDVEVVQFNDAEAVSTAGPAVSVAATDDDVAAYLASFADFTGAVTAA